MDWILSDNGFWYYIRRFFRSNHLYYVCELFLFYLRGVLFARVIVSRNGNLYPFTNHLYYTPVHAKAFHDISPDNDLHESL